VDQAELNGVDIQAKQVKAVEAVNPNVKSCVFVMADLMIAVTVYQPLHWHFLLAY
jgi:hypothetical protein